MYHWLSIDSSHIIYFYLYIKIISKIYTIILQSINLNNSSEPNPNDPNSPNYPSDFNSPSDHNNSNDSNSPRCAYLRLRREIRDYLRFGEQALIRILSPFFCPRLIALFRPSDQYFDHLFCLE